MKFHVVLEKEPEGGYSAQCVEIPGAISQGETQAEALQNAREAIALILETRREEAHKATRNTSRRLQTVEVDA